MTGGSFIKSFKTAAQQQQRLKERQQRQLARTGARYDWGGSRPWHGQRARLLTVRQRELNRVVVLHDLAATALSEAQSCHEAAAAAAKAAAAVEQDVVSAQEAVVARSDAPSCSAAGFDDVSTAAEPPQDDQQLHQGWSNPDLGMRASLDQSLTAYGAVLESQVTAAEAAAKSRDAAASAEKADAATAGADATTGGTAATLASDADSAPAGSAAIAASTACAAAKAAAGEGATSAPPAADMHVAEALEPEGNPRPSQSELNHGAVLRAAGIFGITSWGPDAAMVLDLNAVSPAWLSGHTLRGQHPPAGQPAATGPCADSTSAATAGTLLEHLSAQTMTQQGPGTTAFQEVMLLLPSLNAAAAAIQRQCSGNELLESLVMSRCWSAQQREAVTGLQQCKQASATCCLQ